MPECVSPLSLKSDGSCLVLDVRTAPEHAQAALDMPHCHVPLDQLDVAAFVKERGIAPDQTVYLLCRAGGRAARAADAFVAAGYPNVRVIDGGIIGCAQMGMPVISGCPRVMSLERQVRILAGALVVVGVLLGALVHPGFYGLSAFIGAGLVFAGVTDTCGMGLLLARMPWNK